MFSLSNNLLENIIEKISIDKTFLSKGEADIRQGIVLPILACLGWDRDNVNEVVPEFTSGGGKVDYCLVCNNKESVLIEVKRAVEELRNHQQQLLEYAFKLGIPLAVLTNGFEWWLYLPLEEGRWEERRFLDIDIREKPFEVVAEYFRKFLNKKEVEENSAVKAAQELKNENKIQILIDATIPEAWNALLKEQDELLLDLLADKVKDLCGFRPNERQIRNFIASIFRQNIDHDINKGNYPDLEKTDTNTRNISKITKHKKEVKIKDLINAGLIKPNTIIYKIYNGKKYEARILENGEIMISGFNIPNFKSPSAAAGYITKNSVNGWIWWQCRDKDGREVILDDYREKLISKNDFQEKQKKLDDLYNRDLNTSQEFRKNITITDQFTEVNDNQKREIMKFTRLEEATFGKGENSLNINREDNFDLNWLGLRKLAAKSAIKAGKRNELLAMAGYADLNSKNDWNLYSELGIKIQQYGAAETCKSAIQVAKMLKSIIEIKFYWENKKGAKYPGEKGYIYCDFSKE